MSKVVAYEAGKSAPTYETTSQVDPTTGLSVKARSLVKPGKPMVFKETFAPAPKGEKPAAVSGGSACSTGKACG